MTILNCHEKEKCRLASYQQVVKQEQTSGNVHNVYATGHRHGHSNICHDQFKAVTNDVI